MRPQNRPKEGRFLFLRAGVGVCSGGRHAGGNRGATWLHRFSRKGVATLEQNPVWETPTAGIGGDGGPETLVDETVAQVDRRFYRVRLAP